MYWAGEHCLLHFWGWSHLVFQTLIRFRDDIELSAVCDQSFFILHFYVADLFLQLEVSMIFPSEWVMDFTWNLPLNITGFTGKTLLIVLWFLPASLLQTDQVERNYIKEKKAAVKEFDDKKVELKENLIAELEEKKKMIENEKLTMELTGGKGATMGLLTRDLLIRRDRIGVK